MLSAHIDTKLPVGEDHLHDRWSGALSSRIYCWPRVEKMIIVSGWFRVASENRSTYLVECRSVVEAARCAPGCMDFSLSPDLLDHERINVFEQWETVDAVERFRGSGPSDDQQTLIIEAHVFQHEIASSAT